MILLAVEHEQREKANPGNPGEVGAPMSGVVIEMRAKGLFFLVIIITKVLNRNDIDLLNDCL